MSALVALTDVTVTYRDAEQPALHGASLSIQPGEIVVVAGPSGCGKSTLLRLINGLVPRSYRAEVSGEVRIAGSEGAGLSLREIAETVGTLLQDPAKQVVGHSVLAEIAFGLENRAVAPAEIHARAVAVARRLNIEHLLSTAPHELSGGQLQLVAFAGVLVLRPRLIVIDEPLANLDPDAADVLLTAVRAYVADGGAAIVVEHRVDEVLSIAPNRVVYLEDGRIVYAGDVPGFLKTASPLLVKLPFDALLSRDDLPPYPPSNEHKPDPDPTAPTRLRFDAVELGYGARTILPMIDRQFGAGERVAVLGRNGAGKSTLMRAAVGLIEPRHGRVLVDARSVSELTAPELVGICGYLFQNPAQSLFSATVRDELEFGPRNLGVPEHEIPAVVDAALRAVALDSIPDIHQRPPRTLSFGQQRRLAVALALTLRPKTLILDEPTAGQDEQSAAHFLDAVWALDHVDSVYFITHDIDMALSRADRVIVVDAGGIAADASPAEIVRDQGLWHKPGDGSPDQATLRETDYVRAARRYGPPEGRIPRLLDLARLVRRSDHGHLPNTATDTTDSSE